MPTTALSGRLDEVVTVFDGHLHVHYGQAYVFSGTADDTSDMEACFRGQSNGLLGAAQQGMLFLMTGLHTGLVRFRVEVRENARPQDPSWEECVEASFVPADRDVRLISWDGDIVCQLPLEPTPYRARYEARGMDAGHAADTVLEVEDPVDEYRLSFWPSPPERDLVVRETSAIARYWHSWARELR